MTLNLLNIPLNNNSKDEKKKEKNKKSPHPALIFPVQLIIMYEFLNYDY